jgi:hypothetical protein
MVADIVALLFVAAITVRGYLRGLLSQVATIAAALALWFFFESWFPPVDLWLTGLHEVFAQFAILRRMAAFSGAYLVVVLLLTAIEHLLVARVRFLTSGNTWMGALLGLVKGVAYAVLIVWLIQVGSGGGEAVSEKRQPAWMSDSVVFAGLAVWNPVRVMSAREMLERSGAEEWGRRTYTQLAREPMVRRILEERGLPLPAAPAENDAVNTNQEPSPTTVHAPASELPTSSGAAQPPE